MISAILFDLDGTLLDSTELILGGYKYTVQKHMGLVTTDDDWYPLFGLPLRNQFARFDPENADEFVKTYRKYYALYHDKSIKLYPNVKEIVEKLYNDGIKLGVVTSKLGYFSQKGLDVPGLNKYFQTVVAEDDVKNQKPDSEPVILCAERLNTPISEVLMIGDTPYDIMSADAAGAESAAALWGPYFREKDFTGLKVNYMLHDIGELPDIMGINGSKKLE